MPSPIRKATNLTLDTALLAEARAHDVNLSRAAEDGLRAALRAAKAARWQEENAKALADSNSWVEENGLPLAAYRPF